jgi:hypothetical protein
MNKKLPFILLIIGSIVLTTNQAFTQAWKLAGNALTGTEKTG